MTQTTLTLNNLFKNSFLNHGEKVALHSGTKKITYRDLYFQANQVAHAMIDCGVKRNTRVALLMSNCIEFVVSEMAIYFSGATEVPLNDMLGKEDIRHILKDSDAEILFVDEQFFEIITSIKPDLPNLKTIIGISETGQIPNKFISWGSFYCNKPGWDLNTDVSPDDNSKIMYSGGTTGFPKGVVHAHKRTYLAITSILVETNMKIDEKILLNTPLPHAAYLDLTAGLVKGAEIYIESKFDIEYLLNKIEKDRITYLSLVPTMIYRILDFMEGKNFDVSSIRTIKYGASPITEKRLREGLKVFGKVFLQIYGSAESQNCPSILKKEDHRTDPEHLHLLQSCGQPTIFSQIKIVDDKGSEVELGQVGEIVVNTPTCMVRYYNNPEKTAKVLKKGWLYTGDVGYKDKEGYLYLLDRKKDMIVTGGMNVYSTEVENVIQKHPDVRLVAVIGIPDDDWGEAVTAFIVPKNKNINIKDIKEYCKQQLSKYKNPKTIQVVEALPMTNYKKLDKKALRDPYWKLANRQI